MREIDFLPDEYRKEHARRYDYVWRATAMLAALAVLAAVAVAQHGQYRHARRQLATITDDYNVAVAQTQQRDRLRSQCETARADAELFTYLRHPWPRTRILATMVDPLPEPISLERLDIRIDGAHQPSQNRARSRGSRSAEEDAADAKLPAATRDLRELREQTDPARTIVTISGTTRRVDLLHQYLGELARSTLVAKAELDSLESVAKKSDANDEEGAPMRFAATVVLRPGYGQPAGPTGAGDLAEAGAPRHSHPIPENHVQQAR